MWSMTNLRNDAIDTASAGSSRWHERRNQSNVVVIDSRGRIGGAVSELISRRELLSILIWRDIKVRYKQTVFGILWALLLPLIQTVIFAMIFGRFAHIPPDGNYSYTVFV